MLDVVCTRMGTPVSSTNNGSSDQTRPLLPSHFMLLCNFNWEQDQPLKNIFFLQYLKVACCTKSKAFDWAKEQSEYHAGKISPIQRLGYEFLGRPQPDWCSDTSEPVRFCRRWTAAMWSDKAVSVWSDRLRSVGPAQCKMPVDHSIGPRVCKMC